MLQPLTIEQKAKREQTYHRYAHTYPALMSVVILIVHFAITELSIWGCMNLTFKVLTIVMELSVTVCFLFLYKKIIRRISKDFIETNILFREYRKPTTRLMLKDDNTFTKDKKERILAKLKSEGVWNNDIKVRGKDTTKYIESVDMAVSHILEVTRPDDILFEENYTYGMFRNLCGGLLLNVVISLLILIMIVCIGVTSYSVVLYGCLGQIFLLLLVVCLADKEGLDFAKRMYNVYLEC